MARHLLVTNDFPPKTGGIQVYLYELWRRLNPGRAVILSASSHPDVAGFDASSEVETERVAARTLYFPSRRTYREIEAAIARHQPDLVLLDPAWPLGLVGPRLSVPFGVLAHGAEVAIPARIPLVASSLRYVLRRAAVVICAGPYPEGEVRRCVGEGLAPLVRVSPGVDPARFRPASSEERRATREQLGWADDDFVVASFSRLVPRKGMDTLIKASARLAPRWPHLRIVIAGTGRDRTRLERLVRRHRAPVSFVGRTSDDLHPRFIAASDLMVMNCRSRWLGLEREGFGIVFLEAAACGIAQIAGRSGGSHDAVRDGETGIVLERPRRVSDLVDALESLMTDESMRLQMASRSREVVQVEGAWDVLTERLARGLEAFDHAEDEVGLTYGVDEEVQ